MLVSESMDLSEETPAHPIKFKRRSLMMRDINKRLKKIKRHVGSFDSPLPTSRSDDDISTSVDSSIDDSSVALGYPECNDSMLEDDFLDIISKLQGSRIEDQRSEMPAALLKQNLKSDSNNIVSMSPANEKKDEKEPITEVLALGAPYPMVVLPVDGEYWMEGTYHILSRDMNKERPIFPTIDMSLCSLEEDTSVYNYRKNFAGKEHMNFAAIDSQHGHVLMSVLFEQSSTTPKGNLSTTDRYKVILRLKDKTIDKIIPASSFRSDHPGPKDFMKIMLPEDLIDVERFHPIAIPRASEDIMKFDEHSFSNCYKIGVIQQKHGQVSEEDFLQNQGESPALREFMDMIGDRVALKDFENYRGGLDVKHGQTGEYSYYSNFKEREVMFHVSTLIPHTPNDPQQLNRKRHIGNDVVSIVFQEENTPFSPSSIRSHFLHCFIVVQVENPNTDNTHYKVSVAAKEGVPKFAPNLPNPCIFRKGKEFRNFLLTKVLNAENAAVKSDKFSVLAERTRSMLLQGIVSDFITKNGKMLGDNNCQEQCCEPLEIHHSKSGSILSTFRSALHRGRTETDATSMSSTSSNGTTSLNVSKLAGHSLSLNDLNSYDSEEGSQKDSGNGRVSPSNRKGKKEKEKQKKEKSKSHSIFGLSPSTTLPKAESDGGRISPALNNSLTPKIENILPRTRSRQYTNQLFETTEAAESKMNSMNTTGTPKSHSLPRSVKYNTTPVTTTEPHSPTETVLSGKSPPPIMTQVSINTMQEDEDQLNNNSHTSTDTEDKLESAQVEIERLKAEINKLRIDKMDLVRQNVIHQREIKKLNERLSPNHHVSSELRKLSLRTSYDPRRVYNATATTFAEFV